MANQLPFKFPERYRSLEKRLDGGQGCVYLCKDTYLERTVAVKVVNTPSSLKSLRQEFSFLADIRSPHVAEIYDLLESSSGKQIGLVEQFVSGNHLLEDPKTSTRAEFLKTLYQLSCGLTDIHIVKKIHRDIKPSNVRFDEEGILKILDFGISTHVESEAVTNHGKGTLPYIAPELHSLPAKYTSAVDIYSFGVLAYQLAFNKLDSSLTTVPPQLNSKPKSFGLSPLDIPSELVSLLDRTLAVPPVMRPSAAELKDGIERRLNFGLHRAAISHKGSLTILNEANKSVELKVQDCSIVIRYDGLRFTVASVSGRVDINNVPAKPSQELPPSCVVAMNAENGRQFITIDMSHPGVLL